MKIIAKPHVTAAGEEKPSPSLKAKLKFSYVVERDIALDEEFEYLLGMGEDKSRILDQLSELIEGKVPSTVHASIEEYDNLYDGFWKFISGGNYTLEVEESSSIVEFADYVRDFEA